MIQCANCSAQLADDSKFCNQCGKPVQSAKLSTPKHMDSASQIIEQAPSLSTEPTNEIKTQPTDLEPVFPEPNHTADEPNDTESQVEDSSTTEDQVTDEDNPSTQHITISVEDVQFCGNCGARLPKGCEYCLICGTKFGEVPQKPFTQQPIPPKSTFETGTSALGLTDDYEFFKQTMQQDSSSPARGRRILIAASVLALLLVAGVVGVWIWQLLPYMSNSGKNLSQNAIVYKQDGQLLFRTPVMKQSEVISTTFKTNGASSQDLVQSSSDGRYLAYLNHYKPLSNHWAEGKGDLYIFDLTKANRSDTPRGEGVNIATNVTTDFRFSQDGTHIIYLTKNGDLYAYNYLLAWRLDTDVKGIYDVNATRVLYFKGNAGDISTNGSRVDVYTRSLEQESDDKVRIDSGVSEMLDWTKDFNRFYYLRNEWDAVLGAYRQDLCSYNVANNAYDVIQQGVANVVDVSASAHTAYYLMPERVNFSYDDLIDDDLAESDETVVEPNIEEYPLLEEFYRYYGEDSSTDEKYTQSMDFEQISRQRALYERDVEEYANKVDRDDLRDTLRLQIRKMSHAQTNFYTLYRYQDGRVTKMSAHVYPKQNGGGVLDVLADAEKGYTTFCVAELDRMKPLKMSEFWENANEFNVLEQIQMRMPFSVQFISALNPVKRIFISDQKLTPRELTVTERVDGIYFTLQETNSPTASTELYYAPIKNGMPRDAVLVDKDVQLEKSEVEFAGRVLYKKDENHDGLFDLYAVQDGIKERIAYDIASGPILKNEGKALFFYQQYDPRTQTGELNMLTKDKKLVSANVREFYYRRDNLIYLLCGSTPQEMSLYVYNGDQVLPIASNVEEVYDFASIQTS